MNYPPEKDNVHKIFSDGEMTRYVSFLATLPAFLFSFF